MFAVDVRLFTLAEANAMLPELKVQLARLQALIREIEQRMEELHRMKKEYRRRMRTPNGGRTERDRGDPFFLEESRIEFLRMEAEMVINNFRRSGVLLKSVFPGLLDFPSVLDGKQVLICWKEGEERATCYHGWHDGFQGRRPHPDA
ncbi:MAG: cell division protein DivIVA [Thermobacillus sp. ZCTH02-B1]|nr:MAG: cell division protein DivIVA [Thermobacillus sp. ZCTH02-B1]